LGDRWIGVFQLKRYFGSFAFGAGLMSLSSSVDLEMRNRLPPWYSL
jgi:hypothetical protein